MNYLFSEHSDFSQTLRSVLDSNPGLKAIILHPLHCTGTAAFIGDMSLLQVSSRGRSFLQHTKVLILLSLQPFIAALDTQDFRVRVMPLFPVGPSMLGDYGITLIEPYQTSYMMFLASQIPDLISFFESRHQRTQGNHL
jgi:hypothetical protein